MRKDMRSENIWKLRIRTPPPFQRHRSRCSQLRTRKCNQPGRKILSKRSFRYEFESNQKSASSHHQIRGFGVRGARGHLLWRHERSRQHTHHPKILKNLQESSFFRFFHFSWKKKI